MGKATDQSKVHAMDILEERLRELGYGKFHAVMKRGPFAAEIIDVQADIPDGSAARLIYKQPPSDRKSEIAIFQSLGEPIAPWAPRVAACFAEEPIALLTHYAGEPLIKLYKAFDVEQKKKLLSAIAGKLAALHANTAAHVNGWIRRGWIQPYPFSREWADWSGRQLSRLQQCAFPFDAGAIYREIEMFAGTFLPHYASTLRCPAALTHGDPHMGNILDDGARMTFIDWEWSNAATPVRDIAILTQDVEEDELAEFLLNEYMKELLKLGMQTNREDLQHDYHCMLLDNTIMMAGWDVELYFLGEKTEEELARTLGVKERRIQSCREAVGY